MAKPGLLTDAGLWFGQIKEYQKTRIEEAEEMDYEEWKENLKYGSGEGWDMARNIESAKEVSRIEREFQNNIGPRDYVGLEVAIFKALPGHFHEIENVITECHYFYDEALLYYSVALLRGKFFRGKGR